jgi:hypothetical protein
MVSLLADTPFVEVDQGRESLHAREIKHPANHFFRAFRISAHANRSTRINTSVQPREVAVCSSLGLATVEGWPSDCDVYLFERTQ